MKPEFLVIDDEEGIRYTFATFLSEKGYEVSTACNYEKAMEEISQKNFDVIFTDIVMEGRSGIDLLKAVKEKNLLCPIIIITGYPNMDTAREAVKLGAFAYIPKPVNKEVLLRNAETALKYKKVTEEKEGYRKHLEAIFEGLREGIITVDRELKIITFNEAVKNSYGFSPEDRGSPLKKLINSSEEKEIMEALKKAFTEKQSVELKQIECPFLKSPAKIVTLNVTPLKEENPGAIMVIKDETRLFNLEKNLQERQEFHNITGKSKKMQEIYSLLEVLAGVPTTVLITGESGTGKELIADALHYKGKRKDKAFIKVNCSALPENLLESELFGHVKGAFTGAIKDKTGRFQLADGGTIFLDEIGDISPALQVRLLRVLQEKEFEKVGDVKPVKVDVRIIAATNQNLQEKVKANEFRKDLYYRLKVVEINLPPLRERKEDIPLLIKLFIKKFNKELDKNITGIARNVQKIFLDYDWPGNIRELKHVIEHAFILCQHSVITSEDLPAELKTCSSSQKPNATAAEEEKELILKILKKTDWNKAKTARFMKMSRSTLYRKIEEYDIPEEI